MSRYYLPTAMFFRQINQLLIKMMGLLLVIVVLSEFTVMLSFDGLGLDETLSPWVFAFVDALVLGCIAALPMYVWIVKPVKGAIEAAQYRHDILSSAVKNAGDGIVISNRDGKIEYVNQAFRDMLQCENEDVIDQSVAVIDPVMGTSSWKRRFIHAMRRDHIWHDEQWGVRKNGEKYLAKVTVTPIEMSEGEGVSNFVTIVRDQTAHHDLEMQYHQAQKMEAVGTLVGGIAHDFNNMLSSLSGHIYIAKAQIKSAHQIDGTLMHEKILDRLSKMDALGMHAAEIIKQLMTFSRKGSLEKTTLILPSFMKEALQLAEVSLPSNINIQSDIHSNIDDVALSVCANATQLQQLLMNLMNNAKDALDGTESPSIRVSLKGVDADYVRSYCPDVPDQSYVEMCVMDNGAGIEAAHMTKIMEPFFTTKAVDKGTGLGLSMVYGIVQDHHGYIGIMSEVGKGASFHVFLPLINSYSYRKKVVCVERGKGETILLVDDQQEVRESVGEVLQSLGYSVLEAADGVEALDVYFKHVGEIAAVLSDVVMPRMQGVELASQIKQDNPYMPVLLLSGYDRDDVLKESAGGIVDLVLSKPVSVDVLSQQLRQLLAQSALRLPV